MSLAELEKEVQNLSPEELHAFARWLVEYTASLPGDAAQKKAISEGVRRMEDIIKGQTAGLTERRFPSGPRMIVLYHPEFPKDIGRFAAKYADISPIFEIRFHHEVNQAIAEVIANPTGAGHFLHTGSTILREARRRNLAIFPFFVLYGLADERLVFGSLIPCASDPLTWTERFK